MREENEFSLRYVMSWVPSGQLGGDPGGILVVYTPLAHVLFHFNFDPIS